MHLTALIAQFPVSLAIQRNLASLLAILEQARPGELLLTPEGSLSGYCDDLTFLDGLQMDELQDALAQLQQAARQRQVFLWVGACLYEDQRWYNTACGFTPQGERLVYRKTNLATHERGVFTPGDELPVYRLSTPAGEFCLGVQLCRELKFPEQWGWLARQGAQVILHLNNATGSSHEQPVWRSHLVSRAAENQRYVLSANCAADQQKSPTLAVAPSGQVLCEIVSPGLEIARQELDLSQVSNWYLDQSRQDLVCLAERGDRRPRQPHLGHR
ncbi:MAG: carbon-nitrogen hydrolase family protein [Chloroflexota bacterium]